MNFKSSLKIRQETLWKIKKNIKKLKGWPFKKQKYEPNLDWHSTPKPCHL